MDVKVTLCHNSLNNFLIQVENTVHGPGRSARQNCSLVTSVKGIRYPFSGTQTFFYSKNPGNLANIFGKVQGNSNFNFNGMDYGRQVKYKAFSVNCPNSNFTVVEQNVSGPGSSPSYLRLCKYSHSIYFKSSKVLQGVYLTDLSAREYLESEFSNLISW